MADLRYDRRLRVDPLAEDQVILGLVGSGSHILELGCHSGYLSAELQARGNRVVGLDRDAAAIQTARAAGLDARVVDLDQADALPRHFDFDVVVAAHVLEHLVDPAHVVRNLAARASPGCRLIVSVPNIAFYKVRLALARGEFRYEDFGILDRTHLRFFTRATLRELLEDNGWRVQRELSAPSGGTNRRAAIVRRLSTRWPEFAAFHLIAEASLA